MQVYNDPLPVGAMPDFVSGFIGGLTTGFDEPAAEDCYKAMSPDKLDADLQSSIAKLRNGLVVSIDDWLIFIKEFPQTLQGCSDD